MAKPTKFFCEQGNETLVFAHDITHVQCTHHTEDDKGACLRQHDMRVCIRQALQFQ